MKINFLLKNNLYLNFKPQSYSRTLKTMHNQYTFNYSIIINKNTKMHFSDEIKHTLDILEKSFDKLKRSNIRPPERSTLLIYRDCVKLCKKFYWNNDKGKPWSTILLQTVRKDFEANRDIDDSVEIGKKQVQARQGLIELENKLAKVSFDINKFLHDTRTQKRS